MEVWLQYRSQLHGFFFYKLRSEGKMEEQVKVDWERCVVFHGHICPGLAIGFQAVQIALMVLPALEGEPYNPKSGIVSIVQNDALNPTVQCAFCGEGVMEQRASVRDGRIACPECVEEYKSRVLVFNVI